VPVDARCPLAAEAGTWAGGAAAPRGGAPGELDGVGVRFRWSPPTALRGLMTMVGLVTALPTPLFAETTSAF